MSVTPEQSRTIDSPYRTNEPRAMHRPGEPVSLQVSTFHCWISLGVHDSDHLTDLRFHKSELKALMPYIQELLDDSEE